MEMSHLSDKSNNFRSLMEIVNKDFIILFVCQLISGAGKKYNYIYQYRCNIK